MDKLTSDLPRAQSRGFSTLEMLIAMTVLVTAFAGVILLSSTQSITTDSQLNVEALSAARKALEVQQSLARKDFKLVVATTTPNVIVGVPSSAAITVVQQDAFTKKVTATVTWSGTYGRTPHVTLSTLITNFVGAVGGDTCSSILTDTAGAHGNWKVPVVTNTTFATMVGDAQPNNPYPITSVDAYQKRLYVSVATTTSPVGPATAGTAIDSNAVGTLTWSSVNNAKAKDGSNATLTTSGTNVSHYLKLTNFGFAIPAGSTIVGIKVDVTRGASGNSGTNAVVDSQLKLVKADGTIGSTNKASGTTWSVAATTVSYGNAADYWGETNWTPANINNSNFGVVLAVAGSSGSANRIANVDSVQVTVYYTKSLYVLDISNPSSPTFLGGLATTSISSSINAIAVATTTTSHYVYAATTAVGTNQLQIIDVSNPAAPFVRGTYPNIAGTGMGTGAGNSIYYKDGYIYEGLTTGGNEFNIIDVSTPATPVWKGGYAVGSYVNAIVVKDGYAYLSTNDTTKELVVLNITNPANPTLVGTYNATPDSAGFGFGRALYTLGDSVFLGRSWTNSGATPQFYSLDTTAMPPTLQASKSLGTNLSLRNIIVRDSLAFLLLGSTSVGGQLQIINATSTALVATAALPSGVTGVGGTALDCEGNYMYAASVDSTNRGYISAVTGQ